LAAQSPLLEQDGEQAEPLHVPGAQAVVAGVAQLPPPQVDAATCVLLFWQDGGAHCVPAATVWQPPVVHCPVKPQVLVVQS